MDTEWLTGLYHFLTAVINMPENFEALSKETRKGIYDNAHTMRQHIEKLDREIHEVIKQLREEYGNHIATQRKRLTAVEGAKAFTVAKHLRDELERLKHDKNRLEKRVDELYSAVLKEKK